MKPGGGPPGPPPGPGMKGGGGIPAAEEGGSGKYVYMYVCCMQECVGWAKGGVGRTWEAKGGRGKPLPAHGGTALGREHGVRARLAFGGVGGRDAVDDRLGFFVADFCGTGSVFCSVGNEKGKGKGTGGDAYVGSSLVHSARGSGRCCGLSGRTWSRA